MAEITMYDSAYNNQFPAGAQAYAAYVDGSVGDQPNFNFIVTTFPHAQHLSIALSASNNADTLDVEPGASSPTDLPGWYTRQRQRGIQRPCVYASVSTMASNILPVLDQAKIARADVRLWSAHYGFGEHICGPATCKLVPIEMDGTQWTNTALSRNLDQSLLLANFFTTSALSTEAELQSGSLNLGSNAQTVVSVAPGTARQVAFGSDNGLMALPPARLRVAVWGGGWRVFENVVVDGTRGPTIIQFPSPAQTGVLSINRMDAGNAQVGWVAY